MLVLKTLAGEPLHGYGIAQSIQQISNEVLRVEEGSLYPALHRLELDGMATPSKDSSITSTGSSL
ncbi:MAG TPA: helix-turn-helix transcriptional regulator [Bryobacteraceae bacterium]|nr:helix-turn-helix transcriptional regulator [Bryobacteraceae bacterium]